MSTDQASIPQQLIRDKMVGLEREDGSVADEICSKRSVGVKSGTITVVPTKEAQSRKGDKSLIEIGSDAEIGDDEVDQTTFRVKRAARGEKIEPAIIRTIDNQTGRDELERKMRKARNSAHADIDSHLLGELNDSNKNIAYDVTSNSWTSAAWSDDTSSAPLRDIEDAFDQVPGADTMFIGRTAQKDLKAHADVNSEFTNYSSDNILDPGQLSNLLFRKYPSLDQIVMGDTYYSDKNPEGSGVSLDLGYEMEDLVWLGHKRGLLMLEFDALSPQTRMSDPDTLSGSQTFVYERMLDIIRPPELSDLGLFFQNN